MSGIDIQQTRPLSGLAALERPLVPVVENVTHHSMELSWHEDLVRAKNKVKTAGDKIQVCLQEQSKKGGWEVTYSGFSERGHSIENLDPDTEYTFRLKFKMKDLSSDWSPLLYARTKKEPYNGENLHRCITLGNIYDMEIILQSGDVNVDIPDKYGFSPLMICAQKSEKINIEMIELLINCGADVNCQNDAGKTSLMLACFAGKKESVKELRYHGASYDIRDKGGSTAIHWAVDGGKCELIEWMLDDGVDINCRDDKGWTPLIRTAAVTGNRDVGKILIRRGAEINCKDKDGKTALMTAVINGHLGLVDSLLEEDVDISIQNEFGKNAYEMAKSMERTRVVQRLEEYMDKKGIKFN